MSNQATGLTTAGAQAHLMPSTRHLPEEQMNLRMSMYVVVFCLSHLPFSSVRMPANISHGTHGIWAVMRESLSREAVLSTHQSVTQSFLVIIEIQQHLTMSLCSRLHRWIHTVISTLVLTHLTSVLYARLQRKSSLRSMKTCLAVTAVQKANVHISQVSYIVEGDNPAIGELGAGGPATDVDKKVAELIVDQIPNGACLQLGIGGMPNAVGSLIAESDLKDLGVHTEMYVDAFVDIAKAGKITGAKKNIDRYRQAYGFGAGTKKMYDYLDENPELMSAPVSYTNDIKNIAALDNFISINNCVDLDLFGQISSESSGTKHISGAGGQLDFVLGAYMSNGGKSFICCSSTFTDKQGVVHSRIRPTLVEGSVVTDTRANTHYIVTEYGMVNVKGLSTWQKAEAIISVAHPDFRDELIKEAEKMHIWRRSNR